MRITRCNGGTVALGIAALVFLLIPQWNAVGFAQSGGLITTVAGNGTAGFSGDGGPAISAQLNHAEGIAVDSAGNLYIADTLNNRIRKVTPAGVISTIAGTGNGAYVGNWVLATSASLSLPEDVAVDSAGNLYIADMSNCRVRKVTPEGVISTVAGNGGRWIDDGDLLNRGDGGAAISATLLFVYEVGVDMLGNLYFYETPVWDGPPPRIRKVSPQGVISTVAGGTNNFDQIIRNGMPAVSMDVQNCSFAVSPDGTIYIDFYDVENGESVAVKIMPDGTVKIVAGGGTEPPRDGISATEAKLHSRSRLAVDGKGNLYTVDQSPNGDHSTILKITPDGLIRTVADYSGEWMDVTVDSMGNIYLADWAKNRILKVEDGTLSTITTYFPQIAAGGGWSSLFMFTNTGLVEASGILTIRDPQGNPLTVKGELTDSSGSTAPARIASLFEFATPPGGSVFLSATAPEANTSTLTGSVRLESTGAPINGMVIFEHADGATTDCMISLPHAHPTQLAAIPVDVDNGSGKLLAYAIVNPNSQAISVNLVLKAQDGTVVNDSVVVNLGPGGQVARYLLQDLTLDKFKGSLVLRGQNGQTFVAIGLLDNNGLIAAIPMVIFE